MPTTTWKLGKVRMPLVSPESLETAERWNGTLGLIELFVNGLIDDSALHGGVGLSNIVNSFYDSSGGKVYRLFYDIDNPDNRTWEYSTNPYWLNCRNFFNKHLWTNSLGIDSFYEAINKTNEDYNYNIIHIGTLYPDWLFNEFYPPVKEQFYEEFEHQLTENLPTLFEETIFDFNFDLVVTP